MNNEAYDRYLGTTYSGKALLKKHSLDEEGVWQIYGEDPNCDMGGSHHEPLLDTVSGTLRDAVAYGVTLRSFWQWGGGGRFERVEVRKVTDAAERAQRRMQIETKMRSLQAELEAL